MTTLLHELRPLLEEFLMQHGRGLFSLISLGYMNEASLQDDLHLLVGDGLMTQ